MNAVCQIVLSMIGAHVSRVRCYYQQRGINHTLNSTKHPKVNGQVERANRTILLLLSMMADDYQRWDAHLSEIERHLNTAANKSSNKSPFEALHGYYPRYYGGVMLNHSLTRDDWTDPSQLQDQVRQTIAESQSCMKSWYDQRHHAELRFEVGKVVVMLHQPRPDHNSKLQAKYRERPYTYLYIF